MFYRKGITFLIFALLLTGCTKTDKFADCLVVANGVCVTKISKSYSVGNNYWEGAKELCGGVRNLPTAIDLAKIVGFVYEDISLIPSDESKSGLKPKKLHYKMFDLHKDGYFSIFSDETEQAKRISYVRTYYQNQTEWISIMSNVGANVVTVCVKHK